MDSIDLLARENEFKKLNKQLEKKTESLMKEIEEVMQKQDIFSTPNLKFNLQSRNTSARKHKCNNSPLSTNDTSIRTNDANTKVKQMHRKINNLKTFPNANITNLNKDQPANNLFDINGDHIPHCDTNSDDITKKVVCACCVKEVINDEVEFLYAFVSVNVKENVLPQTYLKGEVTVQSVCKYLSAKVKLLQEQVNKQQNTIEKKDKQCEAHLTHVADLESERMALLNAANTMKSETADMKAKYLAIQNRLNEKDRLYKEQRSATDKLTVDIKQYRCKNNSLEARCASHEENIAGLRQQLETARLSEKEYRDSTRSLSSSHETTIKSLEAQLCALRARLAQYRALVANLRAQRTLLSAERSVGSLSAQYCRLLEGE